jgi:hypothetical protein
MATTPGSLRPAKWRWSTRTADNRLRRRSEEERGRIEKALTPTGLEVVAREYAGRLQDALNQDTEEWKRLVPGRAVVARFAARARMPTARAKRAYLRVALRDHDGEPFREVLNIFERFRALATG